jgi:hypothetical protein
MRHVHGTPTKEGGSQEVSACFLGIHVFHAHFLPDGPIEWVLSFNFLVPGRFRDNYLIILVYVRLRHPTWLVVCVVFGLSLVICWCLIG